MNGGEGWRSDDEYIAHLDNEVFGTNTPEKNTFTPIGTSLNNERKQLLEAFFDHVAIIEEQKLHSAFDATEFNDILDNLQNQSSSEIEDFENTEIVRSMLEKDWDTIPEFAPGNRLRLGEYGMLIIEDHDGIYDGIIVNESCAIEGTVKNLFPFGIPDSRCVEQNIINLKYDLEDIPRSKDELNPWGLVLLLDNVEYVYENGTHRPIDAATVLVPLNYDSQNLYLIDKMEDKNV